MWQEQTLGKTFSIVVRSPLFDCLGVVLLQRPEETDIQWLQKMSHIIRKTKNNNVIFFGVLTEFKAQMRVITINDLK